MNNIVLFKKKLYLCNVIKQSYRHTIKETRPSRLKQGIEFGAVGLQI